MLKIITSLSMLLMGLLAQAQVSETRNVSAFTKLEITDGVEVVITQSTQQALRAEATDGLGLQSISTEVKNGTLKISSKGNMGEPVKVYVSALTIESINAAGNAKIVLKNGLDVENIAVNLASGATFLGTIRSKGQISLQAKNEAIFNVRVESASLYGNFKSGAKVNLSGKTEKAAIQTSNGALCNAKNFLTHAVTVHAENESTVYINAGEAIALQVSETARVIYYGKPEKVQLQDELAEKFTTGDYRLLVSRN